MTTPPIIPDPIWLDLDVYALKALERGEASEDQQKRALNWIIKSACAVYNFCDKPDNERLAAIFDGRRYAGLSIMRLLAVDMEKIKDQRNTIEEAQKRTLERKSHG